MMTKSFLLSGKIARKRVGSKYQVMHRNSSRKVKAVRYVGKNSNLMGCFYLMYPPHDAAHAAVTWPWCVNLFTVCLASEALHFTSFSHWSHFPKERVQRLLDEDVEHLEQQVAGGWQTGKWTLCWRGAHPTELWPDWHASTTSLLALPLCLRIVLRKFFIPPSFRLMDMDVSP